MVAPIGLGLKLGPFTSSSKILGDRNIVDGGMSTGIFQYTMPKCLPNFLPS